MERLVPPATGMGGAFDADYLALLTDVGFLVDILVLD